MKRIVTILLSSVLMTSFAFCQGVKSKKVSTQYLTLPVNDISKIDPSTLSIEFASGSASMGTEKLKDTQSMCAPKGGGLKDVVKLTTYYYEVPVIVPKAYVVAKDQSGNIMFAKEVSKGSTSMVKFGYDQCKNWILESMKKNWTAEKAEFNKGQKAKVEQSLYDDGKSAARSGLYPTLVQEEIKLYTAKGKKFDYSELDKAFDDALQAYEDMAKQGPNETNFGLLKGAIAVWEKEVKTMDKEDNSARINKAIAKGLYENLANAYLYTLQNENAAVAAEAAEGLFGVMSTDRSRELGDKARIAKKRKWASDANQALVNDMSKLIATLKAGKQEFSVKKLPTSELSRLKSENASYLLTKSAEKRVADKEKYDEAVKSGKINPYARYVTETTTQGRMLILHVLNAPKFEDFPKEVCDLPNMTQVSMPGLKITSIPPEIQKLNGLKRLDLAKNKLTTLPPEIGKITSLKTLNLKDNPLTTIPEEIKNCTSLNTLNLMGTKLPAETKANLAKWFPKAKIKY